MKKFFVLLGLCGVMSGMSGCSLLNSLLNTAIPLGLTKLYFQCLPEGTLIDTPDGQRVVESLQAGDVVVGFSGEEVKVLQKHSYLENPGSEEFLKVEFEGGAVVDLCGMHRIGGVRARDLSQGDLVAGGHRVKRISLYGSVERSYDLLTEDEGYRIGGVPVNSMIEEMVAASRTGTGRRDALPGRSR